MPEQPEIDLAAIEARLRAATWVSEVTRVSEAEAERRFERSFPSLVDVVRSGADASLPGSIEARLRPLGANEEAAFRGWLAELGAVDGVELVDDDRDWIGQVETALTVVRALGLVLTAVLVASGGVHSPLMNLFLLPVVTAALALGKRAAALEVTLPVGDEDRSIASTTRKRARTSSPRASPSATASPRTSSSTNTRARPSTPRRAARTRSTSSASTTARRAPISTPPAPPSGIR